MNQETKQIFSIRKFKTGTHSALLGKYGIVLAATTALIGAGSVVSADETVTGTNESIVRAVQNGDGTVSMTEPFQISDSQGNPVDSTIVTTAAPFKVEETVDIAEGETVTAEPNESLSNAIDGANQAGLEVKQGDTQTVANAEEANVDYDKQAEEINKTVQGYENDVTANQAGKAKLDNAVKIAKDSGITVVDKGIKAVKAFDETDYDSQVKAINKTVQGYENDVTVNQAGKAKLDNAIKNAKDVGVNIDVLSKVVKTTGETDYDKQVKIINQIVADYKATLAGAEALNKQLDQLTVEAKKAGFTFNVTTKTLTVNSKSELDLKGKEIQAKLDQYRKDLAAYEAKVKSLEDITIQKDGDIVITGKFNEDQRGFDFYKDIKVVYVGDDQSVTLVDKLGWTDNTIATNAKGLKISNFDNGSGRGYSSSAPTGTNIVSSVTGKYLLTDITDGSSLKLKNVGKYQNGKTIDMLLTFKVDSEHKGKTDKLMPYLVMGYDFGDTHKPISFEMMSMDHVTVDFTYLDEAGNKVKVLDARIVSDVDWGQTSNAKMSNKYGIINPKGSRLLEDNNGLKSDGAGANGMESAPVGTFLYYGFGDTFTYDHYTEFDTTTGKYKTVLARSFVEFSLFGSAGQITQELFIKPTPVKIDVVKYTVEKPSVKATTYTIEKPSVEVTSYTIEKPVVEYHLNTYSKPTPPTPAVVTPQPPVKVESSPVTPDVVKATVLPETGEDSSKMSVIGLSILGLLGLGIFGKRKETE
ncbi:LPXTG cell wall anchor domain-containing protein [Streptococcus ovis]|uniref:LPXTG cell wall anchor domain-containing protein n=1 Tax=Streptococcus ovis TaxID=82806 RepID=UPI000371B7CB|nr:LPXTG cell wall anchor domain-containing protein [Streptococcus ovis]